MQNCPGCNISNPWEAPYDRRTHSYLKSICYYCPLSVNGKPPVNELSSLKERINSLEHKYITSKYREREGVIGGGKTIL